MNLTVLIATHETNSLILYPKFWACDIYIDQLVELIDNSKLGIDVGEVVLTILAYADDLVL